MNCAMSHSVVGSSARIRRAISRERLLNDAMHLIRRFHVHFVLLRREHGFESLYQFGARDGFDSERADELDCSGIHVRDVGDVVHRRILHRDATLRFLRRRSQHLSQPRMQFLPTAKDKFPPGKRVEFKLLDRLHNFNRLARRRDVIEPAARRQHLFVQFQNPVGEGIAVSEIVEEPAVQFGIAQCSLNFSDPLCRRLLCVH